MYPLHLGDGQQFDSVRNALAGANFTEEEVCRLFATESLERFEEEFDREQVEPFDRTPSGVLTRLFIEGRYVPLHVLVDRFGETALQSMADLGLIERNPDDAEQISSTVALYPSAGVYVASDRWNRADRGPFVPGVDVVYPAIVSNAQRFLKLMPRMACERFLDLCSGTAVAALSAADHFATHAWALDVAERATHFAEFNRLLNGIPNVTAATGDLYEPAGDLTFDRIVAHPPYVPVLRPKWIYHDGGEDGEQIMRRVVAGVPEHLEPGGLFYMLAMGSDRDMAYERRVREWLGNWAGEFDVAVFPIRLLDPEDFAVRSALKSPTASEDVREFKRLFGNIGVRSMVYAALFLQRRAESRPVFTIRRQTGKRTGLAEMMSMIELETRLAQPGGVERLLTSPVRSNAGTELRVVHRLSDGEWQVAEHVLQSQYPFSMEARTDPWAPFLLSMCDGTRTLGQYFEDLKEAGAVAPDAPPEEFARAVAVLVSGGFLSVG